jgi:hypothetical protein
MKLQELSQNKVTKKIAKVFESYFGNRIMVDRLNEQQARSMLRRVRGLIKEHRMSTDRHFSERNPAYLKLVMMEQALAGHLQEMTPPTTPTAPVTSSQPAVDPKLKAAKDKLAKKQPLSQEEQNLINSAALQEQTRRLSRAFRTLKESEVQQAQVVLAAQDMVDSMQGMIEDATEMQYKELPALVDSIRNQIGAEQANQFNTDSSAALSGLVQSLQGAKQQLETALSVVTGQAPAAPALDAGMAAPGEPGLGEPVAPDMVPLDAEQEPELPSGTAGSLGRERR